jgi:Na+/H+ antiporter
MQTVFTVLILLMAVCVSHAAVRALRFPVPIPLVQVGLGAVLALPVFGLHLQLDPELFLLLFVPPLLFADGWRIPKRELFLHRRTIGLLALWLVFFTVGGVGYFVHWMIPGVPLPVAFALAAVLSPTDAVALAGVSGRERIPPSLMHILEGEALMNDASGLVALKFAVAAALTGAFSLREATLGFLVISAGGVLTGVAIGTAVTYLARRVVTGTDATASVLLTLLVPFAAYLFAEHVGASGVLSAVAAGMTMNYASITRIQSLDVRMRSGGMWQMIEYVFNAMVFLLLGFQFPSIIGVALIDAHRASPSDMWTLVGYVAAVVGVLYGMRFMWVGLLHLAAGRRAGQHGLAGAAPALHVVTVTTLGGVRGAITLAGVLSIPPAYADGAPLPGRDLAVFIASGVILASLAIGMIGLPLVLRGQRRVHDPHAREERSARIAAAQAAIRAIDTAQPALQEESIAAGATWETADAAVAEAAATLAERYRRRIAVASDGEEHRQDATLRDGVSRRLRAAAMRAERAELRRLRLSDAINDQTLNKLLREIDLDDAAMRNRADGHTPRH